MIQFSCKRVLWTKSFVRVEDLGFGIVRMVLARAEVKNAFHPAMVEEVLSATTFCTEKMNEIGLRALLLWGEGGTFSAGADIDAMLAAGSATFDENFGLAMRMAHMFRMLSAFPTPTVALVDGAAVGGALGLVSACDVVFCSPESYFSTPEVRLGIVGATISPYLVRKLGHGAASVLLLAGSSLGAGEAHRSGLAQYVVPSEHLSSLGGEVGRFLRGLLQGGPQAQRRTKEILSHLQPLPDHDILEYTARHIAEARQGPEGREGLEAFLAKRKPEWAQTLDRELKTDAEGT